jgi:hypothetical protein
MCFLFRSADTTRGGYHRAAESLLYLEVEGLASYPGGNQSQLDQQQQQPQQPGRGPILASRFHGGTDGQQDCPVN